MTLVARPNYLANRSVTFDDFIGGLGIAQPPRISLKDDRFTLLDETAMALAEPTLALDIVIVSANKNASRQYYDPSKPYDPTNSEGPLCWSDNGIGPSKACQVPQAATCASCPQAVWGSATSKMTGKPIPACSTRKKLAVLVSGHEEMFLLVVPPDSLASLKQYMGSLAKMPASPEELVTRLKMENKQLVFEAVDWVPENYMSYIVQKMDDDDAASIVNRHDEARDPSEFKALSMSMTTPLEQRQMAAPGRLPVGDLPSALSQPMTERQAAAYSSPAPQAQIAPPAAPRRGPGRPPKAQPPVFQQATAPQPPQAPNGDFRPFPPPPTPSQAPIPEWAKGQPPVQQQVPQGFGFGMQAQPQAPDAGVQGMLDNAFGAPKAVAASGVERAFSLPRKA